MTLPVAGHENTPQVGMIAEPDAEHVEDLALIPVGGTPDAGDRIDLRRGFRYPALQAKPRMVGERMEQVHHLESRIVRMPIHGSDPAQAHEALFVLQKTAGFHDPRWRDE